MHFVIHFLNQFLKEEYLRVFAVLITSFSINLVQTKGISETLSKLIDAIHHNRLPNITKTFHLYCGLLFVMLVLYYIYYSLENKLLTKLKSWARYKMLEALILVNSEHFSDENFTKLNSPIHRVADLFVAILNKIVSNILPNLLYLFIVTAFFLTVSPMLSLFFFIGNLIICFYYYFFFEEMINTNIEYEKKLFKTDSHLIDVLNNMDKVVYRGQSKEELLLFLDRSNDNIDSGMKYFSLIKNHSTIVSFIVWFVLILSIWYMIRMFLNKQMTPVFFVTSLTILLLYKEKIEWLVSEIPDTLGYIGRIHTTLDYFGHVEKFYETILQENRFENRQLDFKKIEFKNVTYKYNGATTNVFENRSYIIKPVDSQIIGITGPSGRGKSTFVKLILKMYKSDTGEILIDDVNIGKLDPSYIRENITYVNQNSKLFDKKVVDNMLYGCGDKEICKYFLKRIMAYPHIAKLYKNMDIETKEAGSLGENLSGGQKQVVNMIGGLINPSRILILDEPTNALDPALKKEVIGLIKEFSKFKQAVMIITHDKDVFQIFDTELRM